ncbi:MAG: AEC family transporter [Lachnospiraceae bacterium]|nr:AEC family transporter [Lachnospiraceae bacterium]
MESLIFAFNAIMPIILLILLGYILARTGFLTPTFLKNGNKLVFRAALPALLFVNVYSIGSFSELDLTFVLYSVICVVVLFLLGLVAVTLAVPDRKRKGVVLQCIFRSNFAIIGIPLAESLGGTTAKGYAAVLSAFSIPAFNILAVIALTMFMSQDEENGHSVSVGKKLGKVLVNILKNPLIIAIALGLIALFIRGHILVNEAGEPVFSLSGSLPFLYSAIKTLSAAATPLALMILGGNFDFKTARGSLHEILIGTLGRVVFAPLLALGAAVLLTRHTELLSFDSSVFPSLVALFGTPVAVSSAVMAEEMNNDGPLAGQLVVWTSLLSIVTVFVEIVLIRNIGLL